MIRRALLLVALTACSAFGSSSSSSSSSSGESPPPPPSSTSDAAPPDASASGPTSTTLVCGTTSCTLPQICCGHGDATFSCTDASGCRDSSDLPYACYDHTNCNAGQVCCVQFEPNGGGTSSLTCLPAETCTGPDRYVSCTPNGGDCASCVDIDSVRPNNTLRQRVDVCQ